MERMLRLRLWAIAIGLAAGLATTLPASPVSRNGSQRLYTKWLPGESKPDPTSPTASPLAALPTTPSAGLFSGAGRATAPITGATTEPKGAAVPAVAAATVSVRSFLDPDRRRFHLDEPVHLFVELTWTGDVGDVAPDAPEEPTLMNLSKKAMVQSSRVLPQSGGHKAAVTYHYELMPTAEGAAAIEPIEIRYRLRGSSDLLHLTTDRFALTILPRRRPWRTIILGALGAAAVLGLVTAAGMGLAARARRLREAARVPPPPSPLQLVWAEVDQVRRLFTDGATKDAYDVVERLVRKALSERLSSDLRHVTIAELSERLAGEESLESAVRDWAAGILDRCGQVKFASYVPTVADQDRVLADVRLLLEAMMKDE